MSMAGQQILFPNCRFVVQWMYPPDCDYEWLQFSGAWARERHLKTCRLEQGIQAVDSRRGHAYHEHNPFIVLKRFTTDEFQGEATYFNFTEDRLVEIASKAKECGVELFVLDDGWFGERSSDHAGLGDWVANTDRLPGGITGLAQRIEGLGMKFGLWFEPEMVNKDSDLYRAHPDWILHTPGRGASHGRHQYVLDFSRKEIVDHIHGMMAKILQEAKVSYIKWDMNRSITECYSTSLPADRQGEVFHRYILGGVRSVRAADLGVSLCTF